MNFSFLNKTSVFTGKFNLKSSILFVVWSALIFSLGMLSGFFSPKGKEEQYRAYAILLEKENSKLNKNLNLCKSHSTMIKLKSSGDKEEKKRKENILLIE